MSNRSMFLVILAIWVWGIGGGLRGADEAAVVVRLSDEFPALVQGFEKPAAHNTPGLSFARVIYADQQAIEWQVRLKPSAKTYFGDVSAITTADLEFDFGDEGEVQLRWSEGSHALPSDFKPNVSQLTAGEPVTLRSFGGRSSDGVLPFFQLAGARGGVVLAIGWSGDWEGSFELRAGNKVAFRSGLQRAGFTLEADQEVRLPSLLLMVYRGGPEVGINQFRRLMLREFSPKHFSANALMPVAASVHGMIGFNDTTAQNLATLAEDIKRHELPIDTFWLDAGWNEGGFPAKQGNTGPDAQRFPEGLAEIGRISEQHGHRFLLWFEPERVMRDTELMRDHPKWLLKPLGTPAELRYQENDGFHLFDLGNSAARAWMLDRISGQIQEYGVDIYRQDCNLYPAHYWGNALVEGADVSSEVEYITGLYLFLDELQRRYPKLLIDNCASGGRRVDFEMMRRSVLLWRSDCTWGDVSSPRNMQAMTYGLSYWLPLHGLGAVGTDPVSLRSGMGYCASYAIPYRSEEDVKRLRFHLERFLAVRELFSAEYYPLTPWSLEASEPLGWQFHDPEQGRGFVQVFCGPRESNAVGLRLRPVGLEAETLYEFVDWDGGSLGRKLGREWMERGVEWEVRAGEAVAKVLEYRK